MRLHAYMDRDRDLWSGAGIRLPAYPWRDVREATMNAPVWLHFGTGNLFRGFIAPLQNTLLENGKADRGIICVEAFDPEIIDRIYDPYDSMSMTVTLMADGSLRKEVTASIAKGLRAGPEYPEDMFLLRRAFRSPTLQLASFTVTEKGYTLTDSTGDFLPWVQRDLQNMPEMSRGAVCVSTALLYERFLAGGAPIAMVSLDNCSANGTRLRNCVLTVASAWRSSDKVSEGFVRWLSDENNVSFPLTMVDKITPRPSTQIARQLAADGVEEMEPVVTRMHTYIAPYVNTEAPQYLVVEDRFPNGRPPLEQAGVYMTDAETVNAAERMKVMTCLNPLHTALAVFGCLLGYRSIADEMEDPLLKELVRRIGFDEGLKVVSDPGIIRPEDFLEEVVALRLPNRFLPDTPQRIASDTSLKMPIRLGCTIRAYADREDLDAASLTFIPLVIAGWLRYLLGVDDTGETFRCSDDPRLDELQEKLREVRFDAPESLGDALRPILSDDTLWSCDLNAVGLSGKIQYMLLKMLEGPGAVKNTLEQFLKNKKYTG